MDFRLTTPVAFIVFNRPETTIRVFEQIRKAKPETLLLIADGPRPNKKGEYEKCREVKKIVDNIDWECKVLKNYSDINLGCKKRISSGLQWVFENVEEAIILEDDCLPNPTFFRFCQEMLEKYRSEDRIMHISGTNVHLNPDPTDNSYYFSKYPHVWGWATWKRAFQNYDVDMRDWPEHRGYKLLNEIISDAWYRKYLVDVLDDIYKGYVDTWDYQWNYAIWKKKGLCVSPNRNLISNIGFGAGATHTPKKNIFADRETYNLLFPLVHPRGINADPDKDRAEDILNRADWKYKYLPYSVFKGLKTTRRIVSQYKKSRIISEV